MVQPIKTEKEYEQALARVFTLIQNDSQKDATLAAELEALCLFIKEHELGNPGPENRGKEI